jgi:hypothetical protein
MRAALMQINHPLPDPRERSRGVYRDDVNGRRHSPVTRSRPETDGQCDESLELQVPDGHFTRRHGFLLSAGSPGSERRSIH